MISISRNEAKVMRNLGYEKLVKRTYSKHKSYYLVEDRKALNALQNYRNAQILVEEKKEKN